MTVHVGDCVEVMRGLEAASIDACVTDPPYELGFMGKAWDSSGVTYQPETWAEVLRVLKPGGHLLAFGGTRTYHRLACAVEDAGFEIRDTIAYMYGSGFPKSLNLGDGWGTALKPAHEPVVVARKPLVGTVAGNVLAHGTGALNIDGCRLEAPGRTTHAEGNIRVASSRDGNVPMRMSEGPHGTPGLGRWPANVVLDEEAAALLDAQTGNVPGSHDQAPTESGNPLFGGGRNNGLGFRDSGGASRFFYCAKASRAERNAGLDGFPTTKSADDGYGSIQTPKLDRAAPRENWQPHRTANNHPTVKPVALMRWLVRLVTPPGGLVLDPFTGSGTTGIACDLEGFRFLGIERDPEYAAIAEARIAWWAARQLGLFEAAS